MGRKSGKGKSIMEDKNNPPGDSDDVVKAYAIFSNGEHSSEPSQVNGKTKMQITVENVLNRQIDVKTMEWNSYHNFIFPREKWPIYKLEDSLFDHWDEHSNRMSKNVQPGTKGGAKISDFDDVVRYCFTKPASRQTSNGIPIQCTICESDTIYHQLDLKWLPDKANAETLNVTIFCPPRPPHDRKRR
jgi:hypothetical protein